MPMLRPTRPGLIVRDPVTMQPLSADGQEKPLDAYWARRMRDGDVEEMPHEEELEPELLWDDAEDVDIDETDEDLTPTTSAELDPED